jgi:hypothetical protein
LNLYVRQPGFYECDIFIILYVTAMPAGWRTSVICASLLYKDLKISASNDVSVAILHVRGKCVTTCDVQIWSPVIMYKWRTVLSGVSLVSYRWPYQTNIHITKNLKSTGRLPILVRSYIKLMNITILQIPASSVSIFALKIHTLSQRRCKVILAPLTRFS